MLIRAMIVPAMLFAGCADMGKTTTLGDETTTEQPAVGEAVDDSATLLGASAANVFQCLNKASLQVGCIGQIGVLPINVNIQSVKVLSNNQLLILTNDLNNLSIFDVGILNGNEILDDVKATVLSDFLNEFVIVITDNVVNVCTNPLGVQFCK